MIDGLASDSDPNPPDEIRKLRFFRLSYTQKRPGDEGDQDEFHIGVYSSRATAALAAAELSQQPGFKNDPDGFVIDEELIDETSWKEGFTTEYFPRRFS